MCRSIWAAAAHSSSGSSEATQAEPFAPATCCTSTPTAAKPDVPRELKAFPQYGNRWEIGVLYGPHGAPDFFTDQDIDTFFSFDWKVHYNSDRTGVRLIGPKPQWARKDGGEAGLHPSNIHDNAYAIGTVDFTGDMPVILGPDGPSLGGFVCPATIVQAELWKIGQVKPGDFVRFIPMTQHDAERMEREMDRAIDDLASPLPVLPEPQRDPAVLRSAPALAIRADGDKYLLIEYGANVLDLNLRFRVHALEKELRTAGLRGILDITPGVRSLHIHYDTRRLSREALLEALDACERRIPDLDNISAPSRVVHLPLSWDDPQTQLAIRKYMQSVRPDAPWCPSNIEFIRRINGLGSIDDVYRTVFDASYLVLGLGDVYLGAPVATPVDPRHRLVTTKYNPARTWTPENAVGIGGAYLCVYGMEGPGGYQFVGRTLQMWNSWKSTDAFEPGTPWLLRFFDRIRFYPVSAEELLDIRAAFPLGRYPVKMEHGEFRLSEYHASLKSIEAEAALCKKRQQAAFDEERERWAAAGLITRGVRCRSERRSARFGRRPAGRLPRRNVSHHGQRVECHGRARSARGGGSDVDRVGGDEDGNSRCSAQRRYCREIVLRLRNARIRGPVPGGPAAGGGCMNLTSLHQQYASGQKPSEIVSAIYDRIEAEPLQPVWISVVPRKAALERARTLERRPAARALPLYGVPFAIKDNFDVEGMATTAGCPGFSYSPVDDGHNGGQAPGCRRDPHRQNQHGPVRHRIGGRALPLRGLFEHLRRALHFRRLKLGFGGSRCPGSGGVFARHRYSGVRARSGSLQQSDRPEADARRAEHQWHRSRLPHARLCFDLRALLRRRPRGVVGSAGLRPG